MKYKGHAAIKADIAHFKAALTANGVAEGFMSSIGPGSASRVGNLYYKTDEEFMFACADALHEEYKAIVDAGIILQIDDPSIADNWDAIVPEPSLEQYKQVHDGSHRGAQSGAAAGCRRIAFDFTCAGAAGTARMSPTFRCGTSSI